MSWQFTVGLRELPHGTGEGEVNLVFAAWHGKARVQVRR